MAREFMLRDEIVVWAPLERCFLLSTSIAIVERKLRMHPVGGRTSGLVRDGDTIRWGWIGEVLGQGLLVLPFRRSTCLVQAQRHHRLGLHRRLCRNQRSRQRHDADQYCNRNIA